MVNASRREPAADCCVIDLSCKLTFRRVLSISGAAGCIISVVDDASHHGTMEPPLDGSIQTCVDAMTELESAVAVQYASTTFYQLWLTILLVNVTRLFKRGGDTAH